MGLYKPYKNFNDLRFLAAYAGYTRIACVDCVFTGFQAKEELTFGGPESAYPETSQSRAMSLTAHRFSSRNAYWQVADFIPPKLKHKPLNYFHPANTRVGLKSCSFELRIDATKRILACQMEFRMKAAEGGTPFLSLFQAVVTGHPNKAHHSTSVFVSDPIVTMRDVDRFLAWVCRVSQTQFLGQLFATHSSHCPHE